MSRIRHRAKGGGLSSKPVWNAGGEQNAAKEAEERKRGGRAEHMHGEGEKDHMKHGRAKRRARGGRMEHHGAHHPGRKRGGGIGANLTPLSTAATVKHVTKGETPESGDDKVE